ncbi:MAG TPA: hypothetical protein VD978_27035 [Azospirillum sp.]|nr:hypothetical protein [Azospirillum sp.]
MLETQLFLFLAVTGMVGHAVYMAAGGKGPTIMTPLRDEAEKDAAGMLWSSERFQQSANGETRPFWIE